MIEPCDPGDFSNRSMLKILKKLKNQNFILKISIAALAIGLIGVLFKLNEKQE